MTKIRNKWLETVKYTGMLDEEEISATKKNKNDRDKKNYTDDELIEIFNQRLVND